MFFKGEDKEEEDRPPKFGGGPHGLGDPEDTKLRKTERDILIPKKIREYSRKEKCKDLIEAFGECSKTAGLAVVYRCKAENDAQVACLTKWFYDEELRRKMTDEYLKERSEFRRTGLRKQEREKLAKQNIEVTTQ